MKMKIDLKLDLKILLEKKNKPRRLNITGPLKQKIFILFS